MGAGGGGGYLLFHLLGGYLNRWLIVSANKVIEYVLKSQGVGGGGVIYGPCQVALCDQTIA